MEYISSDTNVWIDFYRISKIQFPFRLNCSYIMFNEAIDKELLYPGELRSQLIDGGLIGVEITTDELFYADELSEKYRKLSVYDRIALSIAKKRGITLLTGDNALRKAAILENVNVMGTIGLLDRLLNEECIDRIEYRDCFLQLKKMLGKGIRLPEEEIDARLSGCDVMDKNFNIKKTKRP